MKYCLTFLLFMFFQFLGNAQKPRIDAIEVTALDMNVDSLEMLLQRSNEDTAKVNLLNQLSWRYTFNQPQTGLKYSDQALQLSKKLNYSRGTGNAFIYSAWCLWAEGNYSASLRQALKALYEFERIEDFERIAWVHITMAHTYREISDYNKALNYALRSIKTYDSLNILPRFSIAVAGSIYEKQNELDSALAYIRKARKLDEQHYNGQWGWLPLLLGNIATKQKDYETAMTYYRIALPLAVNKNIKKDIVDIYNSLATLYLKKNNLDSCIFFSNEVLSKWQSTSYQKGVLEAYNILAEAYRSKNEKDSTIKYLLLSSELNKKLFDQDKQREILNLTFNEEARQEEILAERQKFRTQLKMYFVFGIGVVLLIIAVLLWRNNLHRKKAYLLLQKQKKETDLQKTMVEQTLSDLRSTQTQLIQSEKMASLGELTAGIAHEIQNPLNFVNNFSDVNSELADELQQEADKGNLDEVKAIAKDIRENEQKINHHGKRADAIVKGMLQHSRTSSGQKESTDINALADEYLRLAYHGLRAKDKSFNTTMKTDFDESIGNISIIPQDIGRVILNLINNAFYAVDEKMKSGIENYEPIVTVSTKTVKPPSGGLGAKVEIKVKDNGNGIPQKVLDKIFQPFFTTKPTGKGTGLGLSLSYDIVKAHGGDLKVNTKENEGSEFIIDLPLSKVL